MPNPGYLFALHKRTNTSEEDLKNSFSTVDIFYDVLVDTIIAEQLSITPIQFICLLGAQMSLWLGIRMFTFVQLAYYGSAAMGNVLSNRRAQAKVGPAPENSGTLRITEPWAVDYIGRTVENGSIVLRL